MITSRPGSDWRGARGEKWLANLGGTDAMIRPVDAPLLRALRLDAPYRVADVACGGGGTTLEILRSAPAGSTVHGYDISEKLIEFARQRMPAQERLAFYVADMESAAPPDRRYDRLLSRFGTMFFPNPPAAFANLFAWLAPGGRCAYAVWGRIEENPWFGRVREVVAEFVDLPPAKPDEPGPFRYDDPNVLLSLLDRAGFTDLETQNWRGELAIGGGLSAEKAGEFAIAAFSTFGELLAQKGEKALCDARESLAARLGAYEKGGAVRLDASVHIVTGSKPI